MLSELSLSSLGKTLRCSLTTAASAPLTPGCSHWHQG